MQLNGKILHRKILEQFGPQMHGHQAIALGAQQTIVPVTKRNYALNNSALGHDHAPGSNGAWHSLEKFLRINYEKASSIVAITDITKPEKVTQNGVQTFVFRVNCVTERGQGMGMANQSYTVKWTKMVADPTEVIGDPIGERLYQVQLAHFLTLTHESMHPLSAIKDEILEYDERKNVVLSYLTFSDDMERSLFELSKIWRDPFTRMKYRECYTHQKLLYYAI